MARRPLDLSTPNRDRLAVLIHGAYGGGKTHLQGDFLRWARAHEMQSAFLNMEGEDGYATLAGIDLGGVIAETVSTPSEYRQALVEFKKAGVTALAVDSLTAWYRLLLIEQFHEPRYPDPAIDGERGKMLWFILGNRAKEGVITSKLSFPIVLWVAPYDKTNDPITGLKDIGPDLPGKLSRGSAGWFDLVGELKAELLSTGVKRQVSFAPNPTVITRQRLPRELIHPIAIPKGKGGWEALWTAVQSTYEKESTS